MKAQNSENSPQKSNTQNNSDQYDKDKKNNEQVNKNDNNNNSPHNNKVFIIYETESEIYIENTEHSSILKILKSNPYEIITVENKNENFISKNITYADGIVGFINLNNTIYLGIIISSKDIGTLFSFIIFLTVFFK